MIRRAVIGLSFAVVLCVGVIIGWWPRARTVRETLPAYAPLTIRNVDVVADHTPPGGYVGLTVTVCNASQSTVSALESLAWYGERLPRPVYGPLLRRWPPGCQSVPMTVRADVQQRAYRLGVIEQPQRSEGVGALATAMSPAFTVTAT